MTSQVAGRARRRAGGLLVRLRLAAPHALYTPRARSLTLTVLARSLSLASSVSLSLSYARSLDSPVATRGVVRGGA